MINSHEWIDQIIPKLFEAEDRYLNKLISELNRANCEIKKQRFNGFMHMGKKFIPVELQWNRQWIAKHPLPTLDFTLLDQTAELMKHFNRVELDKSLIKQCLFQLLHQCNTLQEVRDTLPDCLISLVPTLTHLDRFIQDPTYMIRNDKFAMAAYKRILPKIEFYTMSRMIY